MTEQTEPGTAIAHREQSRPPAKARLEADGHGVMAFHPRNIEEAQRYASGMITGGIVPDCFRVGGKKENEVNAPLVLMGILKSLELGLAPQTGMAFLLPINGRFTVWGDNAWALIQSAGQLDRHTTTWFWPDGHGGIASGPRLEWKDRHTMEIAKWPNEVGCEVKMWRRGQSEPYIGEFYVGDARRGNLWNNNYKKPWIQYPLRMLFNRARAFPMRDGFPDALAGLGIAEEVQDYSVERKFERRVDNSALDDDGGTPPALTNQAMSDEELVNRANAYKAGLVMIQSLEDLEEWQTTPDHMALMDEMKRRDEPAYDALIAANARRYQEIEQAERAAQHDRETAEDETRKESAMRENEAATDAQIDAEAADGDEPADQS